MKRGNLITIEIPLEETQILQFFFRSKERSEKFQQVSESKDVKEVWEKTKRYILHSFIDVKEEEIFPKCEDILKIRYVIKVFLNSVEKLLRKQEKRTFEEIMLDEINNENMRETVAEIRKISSLLSFLTDLFE